MNDVSEVVEGFSLAMADREALKNMPAETLTALAVDLQAAGRKYLAASLFRPID